MGSCIADIISQYEYKHVHVQLHIYYIHDFILNCRCFTSPGYISKSCSTVFCSHTKVLVQAISVHTHMYMQRKAGGSGWGGISKLAHFPINKEAEAQILV